MKSRLALALIAVALTALWSPLTGADRLRQIEPGQLIPDFSLRTLDGKTVASADLKDKVVVLLFVAANQDRSEKAAAEAHQVAASLADQPLSLVLVTADTGSTDYFQSLVTKLNLTEPIGLDFDRDVYGKLGLIVLPTAVVIDREGRLAYVLSGYRHDYARLLDAHLRRVLGLIDDAQLEQMLAASPYPADGPADKAARHRAAAELLSAKRLYVDAASELQAGMALDPTNLGLRLDLADVQLHQGQPDAAAENAQTVLNAQPDDRTALTLLGIARYRQNNLDEALPLLTKALELNPQPARVHYYLGLIYQARGDKDQAIDHFRAGLAKLLEE